MKLEQLLQGIDQHFDCRLGAPWAYALPRKVPEVNPIPIEDTYCYRVFDLRLPHSAPRAQEYLCECLFDLLRRAIPKEAALDPKPLLYWRYHFKVEQRQDPTMYVIYTRVAIPAADWESLTQESPYVFVGGR